MRLVPFIDNADSCKKAIRLLDSATHMDSDYFLGYYNKLMFLSQLNDYDKAVSTVNKLIELRPNANDLYLTGGLLYEKKGDTARALQYFQKSLAICNSVLDTMSQTNRDYEMLSNNRKELIQMIDNLGGR